MQEGICADAASFDLPAAHLATCITEAKSCVDLALAQRGANNAADTSMDPENFAVLKGRCSSKVYILLFFENLEPCKNVKNYGFP